MYLSHACVSFTYNWYYLHLIRVPFLPLSPLSLSLSFSPLFWSHDFAVVVVAVETFHRLPLAEVQPGPVRPSSCPPIMLCGPPPPPPPVDDHVDNLGAGEASFGLRSSLVAFRSPIFGFLGIEWGTVRLRTFSCCTVSALPFPPPFPTPILHSQIICIH